MAKPIYKWKKNLKPQVLLDKLAGMVQIKEDGKVSFVGWGYHEIIISLENMIDTKNASQDLYLPSLVSKSVSFAAREKLTSNALIDHLNHLAKQQLATKIKYFRVLSSVSLAPSYPQKRIKVGNSEIHIVNNYPKKYQAERNKLLSANNNLLNDNQSDSHYTNVVIYSKSKTPHGAILQALHDLDLWRGMICLFTNPQMELMGDSHKPINGVRLGKFHTLHEENGKAALDKMFWFEPNFTSTHLQSVKQKKIVLRNIDFFLTKINEHQDKHRFIEAIVRFVRALDEKDQNTAVIKLWATLETVLTQGESNCDSIPRRISFLFEEHNYHCQILEHIRDYRNSNIHAGLENQNAKNYAFQLQFYFYRLMLFYVKSVSDFSNIEEANKFLDSPKDEEKIKMELAKLNLALQMHGNRQ